MSHKTLHPSNITRMKSLAFHTVLALSPDGEYLAYAVINPERQSVSLPKSTESSAFLPTGALKENYNTEIWVTNIRTQKSYILTSDVGGNWAPQWSPDGRYIAFYSDRMGAPQLWVWDKIENKQRRISDKPLSAIYGFEVPLWTSDGKHLITKLRPEGEDYFKVSSADSNEQTIKVWETGTDTQDGAARKAQRPGHIHGDLAIFNFETGEDSIRTHGLYTLDTLLSPDDTAVAVLNLIGQEKLTSQEELLALILVPLDGTPVRHLATNIPFGIRRISWSPDGKHLVYAHPDGLFITSIAGNEQRNLTADLAEKPNFFIRPLWSPSGTTIFCGFDGHVWELQTDGSGGRKLTEGLNRNIMDIVSRGNTHTVWQSSDTASICIRTHDPETRYSGFYQIDTDKASATCLFEVPMNLSNHPKVSTLGYGTQIIYTAESESHPVDVWIADIVSGKRQQITDLNPHLSDKRFGEKRLIASRTADGQDLRGTLMLPVGYEEGKRYPLVASIYPGSNLSDDVHRFESLTSPINFQLLANRGYAVLGIDIPLHTNEPLKETQKFVLLTVDKVIEMGIADPNRLGIIGYSYGGYGTVGLISHTTRFKAAVAGGAPYNLTSFYGWMDKAGRNSGIGWAETGQGRMSGSLWEHRQQYIDNSPIFHLDKIETPLLVYCGDGGDSRDFAQSGELFSGLRRLNKTATLVYYSGESHATSTWQSENQIDLCERILSWFDKHLK